MAFKPEFVISPAITEALMRIEADRDAVTHLPITVEVLQSLRETARLVATHYSTQIEGNRLTQQQVEHAVIGGGHIPGHERDEKEVQAYYRALTLVEELIKKSGSISEADIRSIHGEVLSERKSRKPRRTPYRDGQNVIRDGATGATVYLPPEADDVPQLMKDFVSWLNTSIKNRFFPVPIIAGVAHYQFATIHPYWDGNGRTARLLTNLILHKCGYGLKGIYSLDEYYARELGAYYDALVIGDSHNYYMGRAQADITRWLEYFCKGMESAFSNVRVQAEKAAGKGHPDQSKLLRLLDSRQREVLELFQYRKAITASDIAELFELVPRTARLLCAQWVEQGFFEIENPSNKARSYRLAERYEQLIIASL